MTSKKQIDPAQALDTLFHIVQQEALANPAFGRRLLEAVGYTVVYRGDEAVAALDPVLVALQGPEEFRRTFVSMSKAHVKKVGEASGLFAKREQLPAVIGPLVDLLWERSSQRARDLLPIRRTAAE